LHRGPHQSALEFRDFLVSEFVDMIRKKQWCLLPFASVAHLPSLRLSPLGVVPQRDRRPRTIVDYSFFGVNSESANLAPGTAMQFGKALPRLLARMFHADARHGPVFMSKVDIADGFYRIGLAPSAIPTLGVLFPDIADHPKLVAFPFVLPMGWAQLPHHRRPRTSPRFRTPASLGSCGANPTATGAAYPFATHPGNPPSRSGTH
jgi:hypothetical protein